MTLHVALTHRTAYHYDRVISMAPQVIRLRPAPHCRTPILSYSLNLEPKTHFINWQQDPFANYCARVVLPEKTDRFVVTVDLVADMAVINPFDFFVADEAKEWPFAYEPVLKQELGPYLEPLPVGPRLKAFLATIDRKKAVTIDFLIDLNQRLAAEVRYGIRMEPGIQTPEETLEKASGSCRDSGWLLVQILRNIGLAARFVSGYLIQLRPDVKPLEGPEGATTDFTDLHAWAEVYVPGAGWIGLDPTSGLLAGEGHIPLAATPQPSSAAPISGAHEPAEVAFSFDMRVERIRETPRVTLPYSDDQWGKVLAAGDAVDARLNAGDVRLSMGGEPTFVSIDDMEGAEWKTAAVGPTKRRYAEDLVRRLQQRFAPGALLHYGQGKWYPGEPLPRWAFSIYWRRDHEPLWTNPDLIAREATVSKATIADAGKLMGALCEQLGLPAGSGLPAYEDVAYYALVEQKLPINVTPGDNKLQDPVERARISRIFERGLDTPASYVLPVQVWHSPDLGRRWVTERWGIRRDKLFLMPGDAPAGFRLPIGSMASLPAVDYPHVLPRDPFGDLAPLPRARRAGAAAARHRGAAGSGAPAKRAERDLRLGAHRARDRAARRSAVRVPAAAQRCARFRRPRRRGRGGGRQDRAPRAHRGLCAAVGCAHQRHQGHAGPGRDRGQHPSRGELEGRGRHHHRRLRGGAQCEARRRQVPASTVATPAPAAATTSSWAASRRATALSCAARTCSRASSPIG